MCASYGAGRGLVVEEVDGAEVGAGASEEDVVRDGEAGLHRQHALWEEHRAAARSLCRGQSRQHRRC